MRAEQAAAERKLREEARLKRKEERTASTCGAFFLVSINESMCTQYVICLESWFAELQAAKEAKQAKQEEEKRKRVMARLRAEEMTRRRAAAALEKVQREKKAEEERIKRLKSVKRTGGGFVVRFDS